MSSAGLEQYVLFLGDQGTLRESEERSVFVQLVLCLLLDLKDVL